MTAGKHIVGVAVCLFSVSAPAFADVQVTMQNGRVTVIAKDATLRQILTEWARVGQTKVVNVERIPGAPMTLELRDVPEAQALEILLRPLSGYMAAPRPAQVANLSRFDRIVVMPTVAAARPAATASAAPPPPVFQQPQQVMPQPPDPNDEEERPNTRPVFNAFPQPQVVNPNAPGNAAQPGAPQDAPAPKPTAFPTAAPGVAVPGMVVPAPQQQPGLNQQQPLRRPGGGSQID
jgi:hypothetical protein